jgi:hypothetical protein
MRLFYYDLHLVQTMLSVVILRISNFAVGITFETKLPLTFENAKVILSMTSHAN